MALFHGPHAYVSPSWYARKPAVPTWNYAVVHVHGRPRLCDEGAAGRLLDALTDRFEAGSEAPWSTVSLPEKFRRGLERMIVAFEFAIEGLEGKWKLGQNKSDEDRAGTLAGLEARGDAGSLALATFTRDCGKRQSSGGRD